MKTTHHDKGSWEERFDNEVDRLVAKSLTTSCKPLTELKYFISQEIERAKREVIENILNKVTQGEGFISKTDIESYCYN